MIKLNEILIKVGYEILTSECIEEIEGSKTYDSNLWIIKEIKITTGKPNFILEKKE